MADNLLPERIRDLVTEAVLKSRSPQAVRELADLRLAAQAVEETVGIVQRHVETESGLGPTLRERIRG